MSPSRSWRVTLAVLLLAPALGAFAASPRDDGGDDLCGDCKGSGKVAHERRAAELRLEGGALRCSVFMEADPETLGLDWVPCPRCRAPRAQERAKAEFERELESRREWLAQRRKVDEAAGGRLDHVETAHWTIGCDIPQIKVGNRVYRQHEAMHLYAERLETLAGDLLEFHGLGEGGLGARRELFIIEREMIAREISARIVKSGGTGRSTRFGPKESHTVTFWKKDTFRKDEDFHQHVAHLASHLVHDHFFTGGEYLGPRYGWAHEGLAHWVELRWFGPPNTACGREQGIFEHWKGKNWEANVKKAVLANEEVPFADLSSKAVDVLTARDRQFAWSYIDFLLWYDPSRMPEMIRFMKLFRPTREALEQAYGMTMGEFVDGWREFVKREYSLTPRKGPFVRPPRARQGDGG